MLISDEKGSLYLSEIESLISKDSSYDNSFYIPLLKKAALFAVNSHQGQFRDSGEEYFSHPLAVAQILADIKLDSLTIIVALLHDVVEDTKVSLDDIAHNFDERVAELVDGVTKLTRIENKSEAVVQAKNFKKLVLAISKDIRVLIVKLADRLHNMRTLHNVKSPEKRHKKALETLEIYAALAERIGMQAIKSELQDLVFEEISPEIKNSIVTRLNLLRSNDNKIVSTIQQTLTGLLKEQGIEAEVYGREKSPYSIWEKMQKKRMGFEQLLDVMAFRIVVNDISDCYRALGTLHTNYHNVPGLFKDFISLPKKNGYQSLHTIIIGPGKKRIEVQIRTRSMHEISEYGIAAHWTYKQGEVHDSNLSSQNWLKELIVILNESSDSGEFLENSRLEMYEDQVFCFTPKGKVVALPKGASAIDFAYAVHSDLGNNCVGVKINQKLSPLRTLLQNGDQVDIITCKDHKPLPSWEKFVVTGKALNEIRKSVKEEKNKEYVNLGRVMLAQLLEKKEIKMTEDILNDIASFYDKKTINDLFYMIGYGRLSPNNIFKTLSTMYSIKNTAAEEDINITLPNYKKGNQVSIKGLIPGVAVHYAACCSPIPGDPIIGIQQARKGIIVHVSGCEILHNYSQVPETWLDLSWDRDSAKNIYSASLKTVCLNTPGSLAVIAIEAAKYGCNISNFKISSRATDFFDIIIDLEVRGTAQLANIITALRSKDCIHSVERFNRN